MIGYIKKLWYLLFPPPVVPTKQPPVVPTKPPRKPRKRKPRPIQKRCLVMDKIQLTEELAKERARRHGRLNQKPIRAYRCEFCYCWHLTHKR